MSDTPTDPDLTALSGDPEKIASAICDYLVTNYRTTATVRIGGPGGLRQLFIAAATAGRAAAELERDAALAEVRRLKGQVATKGARDPG